MEEQDMCDHLLTPMPKTQSTVLHYACANKNYQVSKCTYTVPISRELLKHRINVQGRMLII